MDEQEYLDSGDFDESSEPDQPSVRDSEGQGIIMDEMKYLDTEGYDEFPEPYLPGIQETEGQRMGWGSFVLGAAAGIAGTVSTAGKFPAKDNLQGSTGSLKKSEKKFISELWKFEEEIDHATECKNFERILLLVYAFEGYMNGRWKVLIPGNAGYSGSLRLEELLHEFVLPIFEKASAAARINFATKIPKKRFNQLCSKSVSLDPDTWIFKWSDSDTPIEGAANT